MELSRNIRALIRSLYTRHGRRKNGRCVVEGVRAVGELLAARADLVDFIVATNEAIPEGYTGELCLVDDEQFSTVSGTVSAQGVLAVCQIPEYESDTASVDDQFIVALDRVGDPGNFGTICRTTKAAGLSELWLTAGTVDPYGDKAIRSALGSQFSMKIRLFDDLEAMQKFGLTHNYNTLWLSDPHQGADCFSEPQLFSKSIIVIGSEGGGVADLEAAPRVTIPMPGNFESLNAAQAATILIFEYVRRSRVNAKEKNA